MDMNCAFSSRLVPGDVGFDLKFKIRNSTSAAADGVGDNRGGSGASGVDKRDSAEAIAAAALVLMNPPVKQLTRAEEAARSGAVIFLRH